MRLFKITLGLTVLLLNPFLLFSQIDAKDDNYTLRYFDNKIEIQFDDLKPAPSEVFVYNVTQGHAEGLIQGSSKSYAINNVAPAQIYKVEYQLLEGSALVPHVKYIASRSLSTGAISVFFNHPVDTNYSQGQDAVNLADMLDDKLITYINACMSTLDIAIYNSASPSSTTGIAGAINAAYTRGVQVRVVCDGSTGGSMISLLNPAIPVVASPVSTSYGIMHNKFVIFDANNLNPNVPLVWTGSTNWTVAQIDGPDKNSAIVVQDQSLALAYKIEFEEMWGSNTMTPDAALSKFGPFKTDNTPHSFIIGGKPVYSYFSPSDAADSKIIATINSASSDVDIATMLITRSGISNAIINKFNSGVTNINWVTSTQNPTGNKFSTISAAISPNHAVIYNLGGIMHHKFMVVDNFAPTSDPTVLVGSHNWSSSAEQINDENTIIVHNATVTNQYYQAFAWLYQQAGGTMTLGVPTFGNSSAIVISPNPSTGVFALENQSGTALEDSRLLVYNSLGQLVLFRHYSTLLSEKIDISTQASGLYFVTVMSGTKSFNYKIIKE